MSVVEAERALYRDIWALDSYAQYAPGEVYLPAFLTLAGSMRPRTVLDAGCGSGKAAVALVREGFRPTLFDLTNDGLIEDAKALPFVEGCLWRPSAALDRWFDYVYCCDVLEHVPPQFTMLAIDQLLRRTRIGLFLTVSLVPDVFGAWAGKPLHQTVQPFTWWRDSLRELGTVTDARDLHESALFFVTPR